MQDQINTEEDHTKKLEIESDKEHEGNDKENLQGERKDGKVKKKKFKLFRKIGKKLPIKPENVLSDPETLIEINENEDIVIKGEVLFEDSSDGESEQVQHEVPTKNKKTFYKKFRKFGRRTKTLETDGKDGVTDEVEKGKESSDGENEKEQHEVPTKNKKKLSKILKNLGRGSKASEENDVGIEEESVVNDDNFENWKNDYDRFSSWSRVKEKETETDLTWEELKLLVLQNEIKSNFYFPHSCKKNIWIWGSIWIFSCMVTSLVLGGNKHGEFAQRYMNMNIVGWMIMYWVIQPVYTVVASAFTSPHNKITHILAYQRIPPETFRNVSSRRNMVDGHTVRFNKADCYRPATRQQSHQRRMELRDAFDVGKILVDIGWYWLMYAILSGLVFSNKTENSYHSTATIRKLIVTANYTHTRPLSNVLCYSQFIEYMRQTLIPAISGGNSTDPNMVNGGWTKEANVKLMGAPRIRQLRTLPESCDISPSAAWEKKCDNELGSDWLDINDYSEGWEPLDAGEKSLNYSNLIPWRYSDGGVTNEVKWYGSLSNFAPYTTGGYLLPLANSPNKSNIILDYMQYFNWIDSRTRVIFVDFVTYSPNADLYNINTLIFEVSATGVFIPTHRIHTERFIFSLATLDTLGFIIFMFLFINFTIKQLSILLSVGFSAFFNEFWTILDFLLTAFGTVSIVSTLSAMFAMSSLLEELVNSSDSVYVSYQKMAFWHHVQMIANASMMAIFTTRSLHLLTFTVTFYRWEQVMRDAWDTILALFLRLLSSVLVFSLYFQSAMGTYEEEFTTVGGTMFNLLAYSTKRHMGYSTSAMQNSPTFLGSILFAIFVIFSAYLLQSILQVVLLVHLKKINAQPLRTHFHMWKYLKSMLKFTEAPKIEKGEVAKPPIQLYPRNFNIIVPSLDEVRLQGMKRSALETLRQNSQMEESALNVTAIVLGGAKSKQGTDKYNIFMEKTKNVLICEEKVNEMKVMAQQVINRRNEYLVKMMESD